MLYVSYILCTTLILYLFLQFYIVKKYKSINESEKNFVAEITHDLKSPTNAQVNMLNMLLKGQFGELNPKQYEMLKLMSGSSIYMSNLLGTLITTYKCDTATLKLKKTKFNITELVQSVIESNKCNSNDKKQHIIIKSNKPYIIYGDKLQIERVIFNLLSNAITYGFKDSVITINLQNNKSNLEFSITNNSFPISDKEIKNIFRRFSNTRNSRYNSASTGLGLYTAKKIIEMHNGTIYAKSTPDGICTFGFKIPAIKSEQLLINNNKD